MSFLTEPVFNREAVLEMVDGEVDFVCELVELFLADFQSHVDAIRNGIATGRADLVWKTCHRLKTSVGNLGGDRVRPIVVELEQQARNGSLDEVKPLFHQFLEQIECFESELRSFLRESQAAVA